MSNVSHVPNVSLTCPGHNQSERVPVSPPPRGGHVGTRLEAVIEKSASCPELEVMK